MLLAVETVELEEVDISMSEVVAEDVEEEVKELEEDIFEEVVDWAAAHMKMELIYLMSPITLNIQSGPQSQTIQGKESLRTRYAQSYWKIKRGARPDLSVLKMTTRNR